MTLALPTTQILADVYASADQQAITSFYSHKAMLRVLDYGLNSARDDLQARLVELLQTYRKELAGGNMGSGGLQFPANLRCLPVLFLGLIKNVGLQNPVCLILRSSLTFLSLVSENQPRSLLTCARRLYVSSTLFPYRF